MDVRKKYTWACVYMVPLIVTNLRVIFKCVVFFWTRTDFNSYKLCGIERFKALQIIHFRTRVFRTNLNKINKNVTEFI